MENKFKLVGCRCCGNIIQETENKQCDICGHTFVELDISSEELSNMSLEERRGLHAKIVKDSPIYDAQKYKERIIDEEKHKEYYDAVLYKYGTWGKPKSEKIMCPRCNSTNLTANKKGFGVGKAVVGGLLLGGVGLLGGFVGSEKVRITCLSCGHSWIAGE